jgi:hypothetical protein
MLDRKKTFSRKDSSITVVERRWDMQQGTEVGQDSNSDGCF